MSPLQIVALVVALVAAQAFALVAIVRWLRRRSAERTADLVRELEASGERTLRGPEPAVYRGGSGGFSRVKGNGVLALTDRRLLFAKLVGARIELPTHDIVEVREEKWFLRSAVGGQVHVVVKTRSGDEVGFFVLDRDAWIAELRALAASDTAAAAPPIRQ
jgi:hypothetical protein